MQCHNLITNTLITENSITLRYASYGVETVYAIWLALSLNQRRIRFTLHWLICPIFISEKLYWTVFVPESNDPSPPPRGPQRLLQWNPGSTVIENAICLSYRVIKVPMAALVKQGQMAMMWVHAWTSPFQLHMFITPSNTLPHWILKWSLMLSCPFKVLIHPFTPIPAITGQLVRKSLRLSKSLINKTIAFSQFFRTSLCARSYMLDRPELQQLQILTSILITRFWVFFAHGCVVLETFLFCAILNPSHRENSRRKFNLHA